MDDGVYSGFIENEVRSGKGTLVVGDKIFKGTFENNQLNGLGTRTTETENGDVIEHGTFKDGIFTPLPKIVQKSEIPIIDETIENLKKNPEKVGRLAGVMIIGYFRNSIKNKIGREEFENLKNLENQENKELLTKYLEKLVQFIELTKASEEDFKDFDPDLATAKSMLDDLKKI